MTLLKGRNILLALLLAIVLLIVVAWVRGGSDETRLIVEEIEVPGDGA